MRIHCADSPNRAGRIDRLILLMKAGHPFKLVSYLYLRQLKKDHDPAEMLAVLTDDPGQRIIVDSGLFSFMFGSEVGTIPDTLDAYRAYTEEYLADLDAWALDPAQSFVVESDVHRLLGMDAVHALREEFFRHLGDRAMYVWHEPEGIPGLLDLARSQSYIGIGIPELRRIASDAGRAKGTKAQRSLVRRMVHDLVRRIHVECGDQPPRIHLLGCTVGDLMETTRVWSCDSTTWSAGTRFGEPYIWVHDEGLSRVDLHSDSYREFESIVRARCPVAVDYAMEQENQAYFMNCLVSAYAWSCYQRWLDENFTCMPVRGDGLPGGGVR